MLCRMNNLLPYCSHRKSSTIRKEINGYIYVSIVYDVTILSSLLCTVMALVMIGVF
jgi:hypothetical protein